MCLARAAEAGGGLTGKEEVKKNYFNSDSNKNRKIQRGITQTRLKLVS